jgi:hypothetical protein
LPEDISLHTFQAIDASSSLQDRGGIGILSIDIEKLKNTTIESKPQCNDSTGGKVWNNGWSTGGLASVEDQGMVDADSACCWIIDGSFGERLLCSNGLRTRSIQEEWC